MVGLLKRMRHLKERVCTEHTVGDSETESIQLLDVRLGPGAMILKPEVKRIQLSFAKKMNGGHMGPRKFSQIILPRLKYHNPAIPMSVTRHDDQAGSASLTVYFASTNASQQVEEERQDVIDMKDKDDMTILSEFAALTGAQQLEPTAKDREEMEALAEQAEKSARDAELQKKVLAKQRREAEVLEQAKRSVTVQAG